MNGEKLRLLRLAMRWQQVELADELDLPQPNMSGMESGIRAIPPAVKAHLSFMTGFTQTFFDEPIKADVPLGSVLRYRRGRDKFKKPDEFHPYCQLVFNTFEPLAASLRPRPVKIGRHSESSPEEAAEYIRSVLGIRPGATLHKLTPMAENAGVRIIGVPDPVVTVNATRKPGPAKRPIAAEDDFKGFSFWTASNLPVIFVRSDLPPDQFQWVIAHELLHLVMHFGFKGSEREAERQGQMGARELLMPEREIWESFPRGNVRTHHLTALAARWNVSLHSIILRGSDLGILNDTQKRYHLAAMHRGAGTEIVVKRQLPRFYRQMCEVLFGGQDRPIDIGAIHRQTGASRSFILDVLRAHSGRPEELDASPSSNEPEQLSEPTQIVPLESS